MASGLGKNKDDIQTKEPAHVLPEESNAAAAAAAAAERPPPAPPSKRLQERAHGPPEAGGRSPSAATAAEAAAAVQRKGTEIVSPSRRRSGGGKPFRPPRAASVPRAREPSSVGVKPPLPPRAVPASKAKKPMSAAEVVESGRLERAKWKRRTERRIDMKEVFNELMLESDTEREMDQKADRGEMAKRQEEQVKSPTIMSEKTDKRSLWRKFLDRIGNSNRNSTVPHVNYETIPMAEIIRHYRLLEMVAGRGVEFNSNALNLHRAYSEFRPVHGDGECFYRSFIFSYLEQVLDRHDTNEEHRLLAAIKGVARQHARLGWASEFSRSHKAFKKLIKKVMRWKRRRRWKHVPTTNRYRKEKLLEFFSGYDRTNDIFSFLRLVAAIWICSHSEEFEPLVLELEKGYTLTDWCFHDVIQLKVFTDHLQITALVRALGVPLRVEYLFQEVGQDLHTGQGSQGDMPRSTCWPRRHQLPPDHEVPRVTVLYTNQHYDIIYPYHASIIENFRQQRTKFKRRGREKAIQALEPPPAWNGSYSSAISATIRLGWLVFLSVCNSVLSWIAGCFGKRHQPMPPSEFSWLSVMGKPILNTDGSCTISACTMCIEAQHRLTFERLHGRGSFSFKAKVPSELKKACYKSGVWSSEDGAKPHEILQIITEKGGVITQREPNNIKLPISGLYTIDMEDIAVRQLMRLLYAHGPVIGSLWVAYGDYFRTTGDRVYRGRREEFRIPGSGGRHSVVCFAYKYDSRRTELHIRIMDNHADDGPLRWILFQAFDYFILPLVTKPVEVHQLRRKRKKHEHTISAYVTRHLAILQRKIIMWLIGRELKRYYQPRWEASYVWPRDFY